MHFWRFERPAGAPAAGLAVLALLGFVGGCGNEKRDFRVDNLNPLVKRLGEERVELAVILRGTRPGRARDAQALREQVASVTEVTQRIAALEPPDGAESRFRRYVRANAAFVRSLRRFVDAFAAGSPQRRQRQLVVRTELALEAATRAQTELQRSLK